MSTIIITFLFLIARVPMIIKRAAQKSVSDEEGER